MDWTKPAVRKAETTLAPVREDGLRCGTQLATDARMMPTSTLSMRSSVHEPLSDDVVGIDWTLVLAGGDGVRLREYVAQRLGRHVPKQYCRLISDRSPLEDALDRMNLITPTSRTLTVIGAAHAEWARPQLAGRSDHVFCQPSSRGIVVASYVALAMISRWHPNATVTIVPTDHYVTPASRYLETVEAARSFATKSRDLVVLLGVEPTEPHSDLGYIVCGTALAADPDVRKVEAFVEGANVARASDLRGARVLRNTMVACGSVSALWELGRTAEPHLLDTLDSLVPLIGTEDEDAAIEYIYRARPAGNVPRDIYELSSHRVAALPVTGVEWIDLGTPERVERATAFRTKSGDVMPGEPDVS
jgi:mannose-1-phosphate guanylyltransferase